MKKIKEQQTDQLIIGNLGPLQLKENLESSSQLVKTIATHSPSEDCALAGVQEGWRSGSSGEVEKIPLVGRTWNSFLI